MGSSKKVTVGYKYYMGLHFGLCHGPVDSVKQVLVGDRLAWSGDQTATGSISIMADKLFGGDEKEGGIVGTLDVMMGGPAQGQNSYLASKISAAIPAFRGILSAVWQGGQVTANNPYVKPWAFKVRRILQGWSGGTAWYPEKAQIRSISCGASAATGDYFVAEGAVYHNITHAPLPTGYSAVPADYTGTMAEIGQNCITARNAFSGSTFTYGGANHYVVGDTLYVSAYSTELGPSVGIAAVEVSLVCPAGYTGSFYVDEITDEIVIMCEISGSQVYDMNPAHIVYQCLTDTSWGMGYPTSAIDNTSFSDAADSLYGERFGLSMLWNKQETIEGFIQIVLDHIGGLLYVRPDTGTFALKLIRSDYDRGTLTLYGPETLISAENYQRQAWGETVNELTVIYVDPCSGKDTPLTVQDMANVQIQGGIVSQTRNYPGIHRVDIAQRVAMRDLQTMSTPLARIKLTATRAAWQVFPGDVFRLTWPEYGIDDVVYRALNVNRGTLQDGQIIIDAAEDVFGLPDNTYLVEQPSEWEDPSNAPATAPYRKLVEAPYWDLARNLSAADLHYVDALPGYLEPLAVRPSGDATNYSIWAKIGAADYAEEGNGDFCASATIAETLTKSTTSITIENGVDLDIVVAGGYAVIDDEYVLVSAIDAIAGTATISRGVLDTVPATHSASARIWFADGYLGYSTTEFADGEVLDVKLLPITGQGELDIAYAPSDSLTFDQRQYRPYPPGNLKFSGSVSPAATAYPTDVYGNMSITWAHRDRTLQTAYIVEQDEASIGPEVGVNYTVEIREGAALIESSSGISGTTYTATTTGNHTLEITLYAMRGGLRSWQSHVHMLTMYGDNNRITEDGDERVDEAGNQMELE